MRSAWVSGLMAAGLACGSGAAAAEGFAVRDFTALDVDTTAFTSGVFEALPETDRLMIACLECDRTAVVDLKLATVDPETEQRLRSGEIAVADMERACSAAATAAITCLDVASADLGKAVGWVTRTRSGSDREIMTYELFLDGDRLTIQAIAETREEADALGTLAYDLLAPRIVGATP